MNSYEDVCDANNLMDAAKRCMKGVTWKYSTQAYYLDRMNRVCIAQKRLQNMDRMSDGFTVFDINERGKPRRIRSVHINERVVQSALSEEVLLPTVRPKIIYDNYASLKGRGTTQCLERLKAQLQKQYRRTGSNDFYVLTGDLHAYFDSVNHDEVYSQFSWSMQDSKAIYLTMDFIDAFGDVGLGLGSQVSQTTAIYYPNSIDHFIKEQLKIKGYGRYMDDFYLIHEDKEYLKYCLDIIREKYAELGIELNENKTQIVKAGKCFKFLKMRFTVTETGKILMRPDKSTFRRERRKLKKLKQKLESGLIEYAEIEQQYKSWRGNLERYNCYFALRRMDEYFNALFINDWRYDDGKRKRNKSDTEFYRYTKFGDKQSAAGRRHGLELAREWD